MKATEQLQSDVVDELAYDSAVDSSNIAVTTSQDGIVTLKGTVPTYMQRRVAERATKRVKGVRAVANDIEVKLDGGAAARDDTAIAEDASRVIRWSASVPGDRVTLTVSRGWITLEGKVEWDFQKRAAYKAVRDVRGVRGVNNDIAVEPRVKPTDIQRKIEAAFNRAAHLDAEHVTVQISGSRVRLTGYVGSWAEKNAAAGAAWSAPGVSYVDDQLEVQSHVYA